MLTGPTWSKKLRTENNRIVNFAGHARLIGQMVDVKLVQAYSNSFRGQLLARDTVLQSAA